MRWFIAVLSMIACLMPWRAGWSQDVALLDALVARTPGATLTRLQSPPDAFLKEAAGLILGYAGPTGLGAENVETAIAAETARVHARDVGF